MTVARIETIRIDGQALKLDSGFLKVPVFATRTGIFSYRKPDGSIRRELRHPDEVFKADSLQTLSGVPLTNRHPSELVNSKNVRKYMVGTVSELIERQDDEAVSFVKTSVTIMDDSMISEVEKNGLREVSCGYKCDVVDEPGVFNGEQYDAYQQNIKYNHLAIVDKGRAGSSVRLRMDDAEMVADGKSGPDLNHKSNGGRKMLVKIDGVEFEADNSLASAITQALEKRDNALAGAKGETEAVKADSKKTVDELQAKFDQLTDDLTKVKNDAANAPKVTELVKARVSLIESAKPRLDKETVAKLDDMSDHDVKVAVIKAVKADFDAEGKSDDYLNARFDAIIETAPVKPATTKLDNALGNVDASRKDGDAKTADQIRSDAMKATENAWQTPLTHSIRAVGGK